MNNKRLLLSSNDIDECYFKQLINHRIEQNIMDYIYKIINSNDFNLNGISDDDEQLLIDVGITNNNNTQNILIGDIISNRNDIYGTNISDSSKWIISSIITLLISLFIWIPIWFYFISILYSIIPSVLIGWNNKICPVCNCLKNNKKEKQRQLLYKKLQINNNKSIDEIELKEIVKS